MQYSENKKLLLPKSTYLRQRNILFVHILCLSIVRAELRRILFSESDILVASWFIVEPRN